MTKVRRTVNFSMELDGVLGLLASSNKQNLSEFLEYRLRENPDILKIILEQRKYGDPKSMIKGKIPKPVQNESKLISAI